MNQRELWGFRGRMLTSLILVVLAQVGLAAQTSTSSAGLAPVPPVSNPCPRFTAGSAVHNPPVLSSSNGVLNVRFSYQTTFDSHNRQLYCFMTPSGLENPTLQVNPGDHLIITVTNNTSGGMNPMQLNPPNCGDNYMNTASLNIHYHGTNTSPTCGSDEVIKTIINSGETFQYNVAFPQNEPPGLYWYHPHVHGIAEHALLGGASGAIIVGGMNNVQPAAAGLTEKILVIRDQPQVQGLGEGPGGCTNGVPFQDLTINNVPIDSYQSPSGGTVTFTPAVLNVEAEEPQFWRLTNSSADTILDLQVQFDGVTQPLLLVAIDGVAVNSQDGTQPGLPIPVTHFRLPPASRMEFIVNTPPPTVKLAQLVTSSIATGVNGDCDPNRPIFNIVLGNDNDQIKMGQFSQYDTAAQRFAGLASAPIAASRLVYFDENLNVTPNQFFMAVAGQPEKVFDPNAPPAITAQQGTVEKWTVENHAQENHEFHFHQVHFLVVSQNNFEINGQKQAPAVNGQYLDMLEVPGWDGNPNHPFPSVTLLIDFRGPDIGSFVFHCHILNHEDLGMMNIIQVVQGSAANASPAKPAVAGNDANATPVQSPTKHSHTDVAGMSAGGAGGQR